MKWILLAVILVLPFAVYLKKPVGPLHFAEKSIDAVSAVRKGGASTPMAVPLLNIAASGVGSAPTKISAADRRHDQLAADILATKNDNDPRLDTELKVLSEGAKYLLKTRYLSTAPEGLNERGTLVFLLGRNLSSAEDMRFMSHVMTSPRCLSMSDCGRVDPARDTEHEAHHSGTVSITLAYPQITALKAMESFLKNHRANETPALWAQARAGLERAARAPDPMVARYARSVLVQMGSR